MGHVPPVCCFTRVQLQHTHAVNTSIANNPLCNHLSLPPLCREAVAGVEVVYTRRSDADLWIVREAQAARAEVSLVSRSLAKLAGFQCSLGGGQPHAPCACQNGCLHRNICA